MPGISSEMIAMIVSTCSSLLVALVASVIAWFQRVKAKHNLETAKLQYSEALLRGAYHICPSCSHKTMLRDIDWLFESEGGKKKNEENAKT